MNPCDAMMRLLAGPCRTGAVPTLPKLRTPHNNQPSFVTSPCVAEADERAVPLRGLADPSRAESEEALQGPRRSQSCSCSVLGGGEGGRERAAAWSIQSYRCLSSTQAVAWVVMDPIALIDELSAGHDLPGPRHVCLAAMVYPSSNGRRRT